MIATICPDRETLLRYSLGMLPEEQREPLDSHLDGCPDCQAMIVTLDDADDTAIGRLRMPLSGESVLDEPQLQDALAAAMGMPAPVPEASDMPQMLGEYRLIEELGRGGMGRVYKALHTKLDRVVAVKVLPRGRAGDDHATNRFAREMKAVGRLAHPNIVHAYDAREIDGTAVLIMELVDGLDLAEIVRRAGVPALAGKDRTPPKGGTPARCGIPVPDACELIRQTALALQCAHDHGLVHRDIKPSNIMLARSDEVKLLDLGLARFFAESGADVSSASHEEMTGTGQAMGTADYMAPEQASDSRTVDIRADIYSLGCTFYKLLTGRAPFSGPEYRTTLDKMNAHVQQPAPPIGQIVPEVPEQLAAILNRMLAKDPSVRFSTPAEVAEAIAPFCAGADLVALLKRAESTPALAPGEGRAEGDEVDDAMNLPSPSGRGAGGEGRRWKRFAGQLVALALFGGFCFALGIMIRITKDRKTTTVEVPGGSNARVGADGSLDVTLPGAGVPALAGGNRPQTEAGVSLPQLSVIHLLNAKAQVVAQLLEQILRGGESQKLATGPIKITTDARVNALLVQANQADLATIKKLVEILDAKADGPVALGPVLVVANPVALHGQWTVVRVTDGDFTNKAWRENERRDLAVGARLQFDDAHLEIFNAGRRMYRSGFTVTAGSSEGFRWIDLNSKLGQGRDRFALGIYEIDGERLRLCLARETGNAQRPKVFAIDQRSRDMLLELQRYRPAADETTLRDAKCTLRQLIFNGETIPLKASQGPAGPLLSFSEFGCEINEAPLLLLQRSEKRYIRTWPQEIIGKWRCFLDPTAKPKTITFANDHYKEHPGIYKLEGDQLTIALQTVEHGSHQRPEKFESIQGSGVALLTLQVQKKEQSTHNKPSTGSPTPAAAPPTVRVTQPVVCNVCDYEEYTGRIEKGNVPVAAPAKGTIYFFPREHGNTIGGTFKEGDAIAAILPENEWVTLEPKLAPMWKRLYAAQRELADLSSNAGLAQAEKAEHEKSLEKASKERKSAFDDLNTTLRNLKSARIFAPCSGVLVPEAIPRDFDIGTQVLSINPTDVMLVSFDVPESTVLAHRRLPNRKSNWELSLPVVVGLFDERGFPYRGKVVSVAEGIDPKTHMQRWQAVVPNKGGIFMPGMSVRVRLITSEPHKVMLVPGIAVSYVHDEHGNVVSKRIGVVNDQNVIEYRTVKTGREYDGFISMLEGLSANDWALVTADKPHSGGNEWLGGETIKPEKFTTPSPPWAAISMPTAVSVARLIAREVSDYADYTGRIDNGAIEVKAPIGGTVKFHFKPGKPIKQGDLLADILSEADAEKLAKAQQAVDSRIVPQSTQDQKQLAQADEQLKKAHAELDEAKRAVKYIKILAPCAGTLRSYFSRFEDEMHVDAGICLLSINSHDPIYAVFDVDERTVIQLRRRMAEHLPDWELSRTVLCGLNGDAGFPLRGKVTSVDSEIDPKTGTQHWHVLLSNKDGVLLPGMFVRVRLLTSDPHKALLVPERSLGSDLVGSNQGQKFVLVVNGQSALERRDVDIGQLQDDGLRVVTKGLGGDDRVILDPSKVTAVGMAVKPEEPAAATPAIQPPVR